FEHVWPFFLPDGKHFMYMGRQVRDQENTVFISSLDSDVKKLVLRSVANVMYSPPGFVVFLKEQSLLAQRYDADALALVGEPTVIAGNVGYIPLIGLAAFSVSQNGVLAAGGGRSTNRQLTWFDRGGKAVGVLGSPGNYFDIALSPDEKRVAAQLWDLQGGNSDVWVYDVGQNTGTRFTFATAVEDDPVWSPDGKWLSYSSSREGPPNLYRKLSSGAGAEEALHHSSFPEYTADWSPDGKFILFTRQDPVTKFDIWILPLTGERNPVPFAQTEFDEWLGSFSPDGRWIAYWSNESGRFEVYVRNFSLADQSTPVGKWQISANGGAQPRWRKDGKELYYMNPDRVLMAVPVNSGSTFQYEAARQLFSTDTDNFDAPNRYVATKNGHRFLMNVPLDREASNPVTITLNWITEVTKDK
ncbi:MAG: hypothetical protein HW412_1196, partial [Bacteroidetes bacterium]|nr:hypothetical protein [Bacteroidota bacterium]